MTFLQGALREAMLRTPLGEYIGYRYRHMFSPAQLSFLTECVTRTAGLQGPIFEIGCEAGVTTVWLNKHMDDAGIEKPYVAIDTFKGFLDRDIEYEALRRGKATRRRAFRGAFTLNKKRWVERTLRRNGVTRVTLIEADAGTFDYSRHTGVAFALIDVDLYLPVKYCLAELYPRMADGGIIVVDDCAGPSLWDGALQAYEEFTSHNQLPRRIVHKKLGVIEVARHTPADAMASVGLAAERA
jgi:O-methyltransferase